MSDPLSLQILQGGVLSMVAVFGAAVVLTREPLRQTAAVSFYGLLLALMFMLFQAPDAALAQIVVGEVALPLMILLALGKARQSAKKESRDEEKD